MKRLLLGSCAIFLIAVLAVTINALTPARPVDAAQLARAKAIADDEAKVAEAKALHDKRVMRCVGGDNQEAAMGVLPPKVFEAMLKACEREVGFSEAMADPVKRVEHEKLFARMQGKPDPSIHAPARGSAERRELLDAVRPQVVTAMGGPVEFVVTTLSASDTWAFGIIEPTRSGRKIDVASTPFGREWPNADGARTEVVWKRAGERWAVADYAIGATDVWYQDYCGKVPTGLIEACG